MSALTGPAGADFERLLRELAPKVLAALTRRCDFAAAEDAVQEALLAACTDWQQGVPANPGGWLHRVAWRRLLDQRDSERARRRREAEQAPAAATAAPALPGDEPLAVDPDDSLALLFLCCHPALTPPSAIALTLRAVGGLSTAAIARAFLVPEATMAQRIHRAKQTIAESGIPFALPGAAARAGRLASVRHVLYLIFDEGYTSTGGDDLHCVELAQEAIRLTRLLRALVADDVEVDGLLALMLLTDARRRARTGPAGELIPLDEQDRSRWDGAAIAEGTAMVTAAFARGPVGPYLLQAAIAALHGAAPDTAATDWPQILQLYDALLGFGANPMVALNRAVAVAMVHGPAAGLALLEDLAAEPRLQGSHRLPAVRAHLRERGGDRAGAVADFRAAAALATSVPERNYLLLRAARLAGA